MEDLMTCDEFWNLISNDNDKKIFGYIYLSVNMENSKIYIGQSIKLDHKNIFGYYGSGRIIQKVDKSKLKKFILKVVWTGLYELSDWECFYINFYKSYNRKIGYNISRSASYFNERNISGQNNPCSKTNMSLEKRLEKGRKTAESIKANIDPETGLNNAQISARKTQERFKNTIDPETGLTLAQLVGKKIHKSLRENGTNEIRIKNMLDTKTNTIDPETGLNIHQIGAIRSGETMRKNGTFMGPKNPKAKKYLLTSPDGEVYIVHGELKKISKQFNLQIRLLIKFLDIGPVELTSRNFSSEKSFNTKGWRLETYDK